MLGGQSHLFMNWVLVAVVAWQIRLFRVGVILRDGQLIVRSPLRSVAYDVDDIEGVRIVTPRQSGDLLARTSYLALDVCDRHSVLVQWVAWQDIASAFLVGVKRPPRASQSRVLETLASALTAQRGRGKS